MTRLGTLLGSLAAACGFVASAAQAQSTGGLPALREELAAEANARMAADSDVARIGNLYTDGKVAAEQAARLALESTLSGRITNETAARQSGMSTIQANLDGEVAARQGAFATLQTSLGGETSARQQADGEVLAAAGTLSQSVRAELAAEVNERIQLADALAHANVRIAVLVAERKMATSAARSEILHSSIAALVSEMPPGATTIAPALLDAFAEFETELTRLVGAASTVAETCRTWQGDPSLCPTPVEMQQIDAQIALLTASRNDISNRRAEFTTMFENFDQKCNQLFNILATVLKNEKEASTGIARAVN